MIDALIGGRLYGKAQSRTSKNGNPFTTAKLRVPTRDGGAQFINVICFSKTACAALLALEDGDSIALSGELSAKGYTDKNGEPQPSLDLLAHLVLTAYAIRRKREGAAGKSESAESSASAEAAPASTREPASAPMTRDFDDDIPF